MIGIYKIENKVNNKIYIGQSIHIENRYDWTSQEKLLKGISNDHLKNAIKRYGIGNFKYEVLLECPEEDLNEVEQLLILNWHTYDPRKGYNKTFGGGNERPNDETRNKISNSMKKYYSNPENRIKNREALNREDVKKKISKSNTGRKHTEEVKMRISETKKKYYQDPENRKKTSEAKKDISEETRKKMSESQTKRWKQYKRNNTN